VEFQRRDFLPELFDVGGNPEHRFVVAFGARELEELGGIGQPAANAAERADQGFERFLFLAELLRALRVFPELRVFQLAVERF